VKALVALLALLGLAHADPELGLVLRDRLELLGSGDAYLLHRLMVHAQVPLGAWRVFVEIEDVRAPGKDVIGPADENPLDLRQAYVAYQRGAFRARVGRQDFVFDLQRFISLRDGPNVRQAFDAVFAGWDVGTWKLGAFASLPVQYAHGAPFDDRERLDTRLALARVEYRPAGLSAYVASFVHTELVDVRYVATGAGLDVDVEGMGQSGGAAAVGVRAGYATWPVRVALQTDAATGAFRPLYPNGSYFTYAGFTGYANLIHLKPSLTVAATRDLAVTAAIGLQWRATTREAVFTSPATPIANTAGQPGLWTGTYGQLRVEHRVSQHVFVDAEVVHFHVGAALRRAGLTDGDYAELETRITW
jgi:hypothetical protein